MKKNIYIILFIFIMLANASALNVTLPHVQYMLALDLYKAGRHYSSIEEFKYLIKKNPDELEYIGKANFWLGLNYYSLKK